MSRRSDRVFGDRFLEIFAVVMLGVATVGTAWCGLQATLWSGQREELASATALQRMESNRLFGVATQALAYDANSLSQYAVAVRADDQKLQELYLDMIMRPAFVPFVTDWQAQIEAGGKPANLLQNQEYLATLQGPYLASDAKAEKMAVEGREAGKFGDAYVLTTVLLAMSLFFAGVTSSFRYPVVRMTLLAGCFLAIGLAAVRLVDLPIEASTRDLLPWL
jgi:hypothetical protein